MSNSFEQDTFMPIGFQSASACLEAICLQLAAHMDTDVGPLIQTFLSRFHTDMQLPGKVGDVAPESEKVAALLRELTQELEALIVND